MQDNPWWLSGKRICLPIQETQETWVQSLNREAPLEKEMATHSSILAWEIPWTEVPGRLQSTGSQRVRYDLAATRQPNVKQSCNWSLGTGFYIYIKHVIALAQIGMVVLRQIYL